MRALAFGGLAWIAATAAVAIHLPSALAATLVSVGSVSVASGGAIGALILTVRRQRERLSEQQIEVFEGKLEVVQRLALAAEYRDDATGGHNHRMSRYAQILACEMGLSITQADVLLHAATLHDVGKIGIPDAILLKRGPLTPSERDLIETHVAIGGELLAGSRSGLLQMAQKIALTHHEAWDGSGYPRGLKGQEIPLEGRIVAVCDVFDALLSPRPYKAAWPVGEVVKEIRAQSGRKFDPAVVDAFERALPQLLCVAREKRVPPVQVEHGLLAS